VSIVNGKVCDENSGESRSTEKFSECRTVCPVGFRQTDAKTDAKNDETTKKGLD
jgi:hypothetical protein